MNAIGALPLSAKLALPEPPRPDPIAANRSETQASKDRSQAIAPPHSLADSADAGRSTDPGAGLRDQIELDLQETPQDEASRLKDRVPEPRDLAAGDYAGAPPPPTAAEARAVTTPPGTASAITATAASNAALTTAPKASEVANDIAIARSQAETAYATARTDVVSDDLSFEQTAQTDKRLDQAAKGDALQAQTENLNAKADAATAKREAHALDIRIAASAPAAAEAATDTSTGDRFNPTSDLAA